MSHVVHFSGGIASYCAAKRVIGRYGAAETVLIFADTCMEDEDLYRFLRDTVAFLGATFVRIADGRTPWDVFADKRFLGNSRVGHCSELLKRRLLKQWRIEHDEPGMIDYVGLDWTEPHRITRLQNYWQRLAWTLKAPMAEPPYLSKRQMCDEARADGIEPPRLYAMGFSHNNCGGFCVKAGQAHFAKLLEMMPERYAYHEAKEEELRAQLGDVSILRDRSGGQTSPLTLRAFRERIQVGRSYDLFEIGGCGCATDVDEDDAALRAVREEQG